MRTDSDDYKMTPFEVVMKYVGVAVAIIYVCMGIAIALRSQEIFGISGKYSIALGGLLIVYGIFRGYRVFSRHFQK
jgi:hypothetical protein